MGLWQEEFGEKIKSVRESRGLQIAWGLCAVAGVSLVCLAFWGQHL